MVLQEQNQVSESLQGEPAGPVSAETPGGGGGGVPGSQEGWSCEEFHGRTNFKRNETQNNPNNLNCR